MRIVIDLQGAQSESRLRGIGRYCIAFAHAFVQTLDVDEEAIIVLNGAFPESVASIRARFADVLRPDQIRLWECSEALNTAAPNYATQSYTARSLVREAFIASLKPDAILVTSLFEGHFDSADPASVTVRHHLHTIPTAVVLYDLVPLLYPNLYLATAASREWYSPRIQELRHSNLTLAISNSTKHDAIEHLGMNPSTIVNIGAAIEGFFQPAGVDEVDRSRLAKMFGIHKPHILYTGGADLRKNMDGLIEAYSNIDVTRRSGFQLVLVCAMDEAERSRLRSLSLTVGLSDEELVLTGYVDDKELVGLYRTCHLFVFPSLYEGFGLPVLEAMACGAPVIGSNNSSVAEIIVIEEALFDPESIVDMQALIEKAMFDEQLRTILRANSKRQSAKYSWENTAAIAHTAIREMVHNQRHPETRPRMAYVSPLPPERSGISYYSVDLLPELSRYYDIDVVSDLPTTSHYWLSANANLIDTQTFLARSAEYDRVLYHFGNSACHANTLDLLERVPGVVVLHDFYLSGLLEQLEVHALKPYRWGRELYVSHGYPATLARFTADNPADVASAYPCNKTVLEDAVGVVVHSALARSTASQFYAGEEISRWKIVPQVCANNVKVEKATARRKLGFNQQDSVFCCFGMISPTKLPDRIIKAWALSKLTRQTSTHLVFVGSAGDPEYQRELTDLIARAGLQAQVTITGWVKDSQFDDYLAAADVGVQLRTHSRGETSRAILDCMKIGLPVIANAHGSNAELPRDAVLLISDKFSNAELAAALENFATSAEQRSLYGNAARDYARAYHHPSVCAEAYHNAVEKIYAEQAGGLEQFARVLSRESRELSADTAAEVVRSIVNSIPEKYTQPQIFVDVSELAQRDSRSGIQRVVKNILSYWLKEQINEYRIEPVYAGPTTYHYANEFTFRFLDCPADILQEEEIRYNAGDIFLGLDLQLHELPKKSDFYAKLRAHGVTTYFVVYDLIPVLAPKMFPPEIQPLFDKWLEVVLQSDGAICISQSVAAELASWAKQRGACPPIKWFHLGADGLVDTRSTDDNAEQLDPEIIQFLMVGTIEPRKRYKQVIEAFDLLCKKGVAVQLTIIGKQGWMVEETIERLNSLIAEGMPIKWLPGASDDELEQYYRHSHCLIAASMYEGFGLPLVEAARHSLNLIVRDTSVFREVAGTGASYFDTSTAAGLAEHLGLWLTQYRAGQAIEPSGVKWLTWQDSSQQLMNSVLALSNTTDQS